MDKEFITGNVTVQGIMKRSGKNEGDLKFQVLKDYPGCIWKVCLKWFDKPHIFLFLVPISWTCFEVYKDRKMVKIP